MHDKQHNSSLHQWSAKGPFGSQNMTALFLGFLVVLLALSACDQQPSKSQVEKAKAELTVILNSLYTPKDAELLIEKVTYGDNPVLENCIVIVTTDRAYQSPHDFEYVIDDYRQSLANSGWIPSPYHRHDQSDVDFFVLGSQASLTISSTPLSSDVSPADTVAVGSTQTFTVYYLQITVSSPSTSDCRAG